VSARLGWVTFLVVAAVGLAGILFAASTDERSIAFSIDVPNREPVLSVEPGQSVCEGPIQTTSAFGGIRAWPVPAVFPGAGFAVRVRAADTHRVIATGRILPGYATAVSHDAGLSATVPAGRRVVVCLLSTGPQRAGMLGSPSGGPPMTVAGKRSTASASLVFLRSRPRSLLSLLPTVFRRAALFRPGWVGAWTFWVLAGALLVAFALGGVAVALAARSDTSGEGPETDG
jgi:hypothetical protein